MRHTLLSIALLAGLAGPGVAQQQEQVTGSWTARFRPDRVNLQLSVQFDEPRFSSSNYGITAEASERKHRAATSDRGGYTRVSFTLEREAGTFTFEGRGDDTRGSGWFRFD